MSRKKTIHQGEYHRLITELVNERKRLALSQLEVAELTGLSQSDLSKIENLERRLDVLEFKALIQAYRVTHNPKLNMFVKRYFCLE